MTAINPNQKFIYHTHKQMEFLYDTKYMNWFYKKSPERRNALMESGQVNSAMFLRKQKDKTWIGGRGSGKTNTIGKQIGLIFNNLPRCTGGLASLSYKQIENNCLPEVKMALKAMGIFEDYHYVYGTKPPKYFSKSIYEMEDYEYVLSFVNGCQIILLSDTRDDKLDRGLNLDFLLGDEIAFVNQDWWESSLIPTVRANAGKTVANNPLHHSIIKFSSAPKTLRGQWVFNSEKNAKKEPDDYFYIESTPLDNPTLPENYVPRLRKTMSLSRFNIEVMNHKLIKPENTFYPSYIENKHFVDAYGYVTDENDELVKGYLDYDKDSKLLISLDFNASFTCMLVAHLNDKDIKIINTLYVKYEKVDTLVDIFIETYKGHNNKEVDIYGDRTGFDYDNETYEDMYTTIINRLQKADWLCTLEASPANIEHKHKHNIINTALDEKLKYVPNIRINNQTCIDLHISIINSPMNPDFSKDKTSETKKVQGSLEVAPEHATHLSDAFDYLIYMICVHLVYDEPEHTTVVGFM